MGAFTPITLQRARRWVLWKLEDGKKKPYSANYNGLASSTRANTWTYYSKALQKLQYGDYNGLGYVFAEGDGLVFIDLDHCIEDNGELSAFAEEIIALFPKTYTEYSQSETGLHIVVKGKIPRSYKSDKIELYASGRYMAFTGNAYEAVEPAEAQEALNELSRRFKLDEAVTTERAQPLPLSDSDSDIIAKAERGANAAIFRALWAGEWESRYKSQSEADLRLISLLYYYSGNVEQVRRLFQSSGLGQRDKGRSDDYVSRTIQKAAENTTPGGGQTRKQTATNTRSRSGLTDTPDKKKLRRF